jgi:hypothetical protein
MIVCKSPAELERMKAANQLVAEVLAALREAVRPGVTTGDLDAMAESHIRAGGGEPAFKGYHGFPATICASVNEEVIHGIPSRRELVEGDVISIDLGAVLDGFYGDSAITVPVGRVSERAAELLQVTEDGGSLRSDRIGHPADRGTDAERARGHEDSLRRSALVVGVPFGVVAAHRDRDRNGGTRDVLGIGRELGQMCTLGPVSNDDERPWLTVRRTAGPARDIEDGVEVGLRHGLGRELADLVRPAQSAEDRI